MGLKWYGEELKQIVKASSTKRVEAATIILANELKNVLVQQDNIDGTNPSEPGEPPAKESGRLSGSISREVDPVTNVGRVGTNVIYGKMLELGTVKMAARPWLRPTYDRLKATLIKILQGK